MFTEYDIHQDHSDEGDYIFALDVEGLGGVVIPNQDDGLHALMVEVYTGAWHTTDPAGDYA